MSTIAIVGGHGKIAQLLIDELARGGHTPLALVRKDSYRDELEARGAQVRLLDIESADVSEFAAAFEGADAVVFAAGGGGDGNVERKRTVDLEGSVKSAAAARSAGITRFVQVSAMGVENGPADDAEESWKAYVVAKRDADVNLRDSGLRWTIVRPGSLTDDPGTGKVRVGSELDKGSVPREDVAVVIAAALADDATAGKQFDLVEGDTSVTEALAAL